jgi:serine protease
MKKFLAATLTPALLVGGSLLIPAAEAAQPAISAMPISSGAASTTASTTPTPLAFQGGSVEVAPTVYLDFWGSWWNTTTTTNTNGGFSYTNTQAKTYVTDYFTNVGGSAWAAIQTQYCQGVAKGTTSCGTLGTNITNPTGQTKGVMIDSVNAVPSKPTQAQIAAEAAYAAQQFGLTGANSAGATIFVFTPSGKSMNGFARSWCAWHSSTTFQSKSLAYAYMPYQPDAGTSCGLNAVNKTATAYGNGIFDGFSIVGGHEYAEAVTDPFPSSGWIDGSGAENGDKCAWSPSSTNITLGANAYAVQPLWSNAIAGCALS